MTKRTYNREKYYSALKTGFKHMNPNEVTSSFLALPDLLGNILPGFI
jgi:hypothetical protein